MRSAQLLAEHDGYPAAIARLLQAAQEAAGEGKQLSASALRLLHRLVAAAGAPMDCARTLELLMQPAGGFGRGAGYAEQWLHKHMHASCTPKPPLASPASQDARTNHLLPPHPRPSPAARDALAEDLLRYCAGLTLRLACQLSGLHPLTCLPLSEAEAAAAPPLEEAIQAGAHAANVVHASVASSADEARHISLARQLAACAADGYRAAGSVLGELRALAVQLAAGGPLGSSAEAAEDLQHGLSMADAVIGRMTQLAVLVGRAHVRLASPEELAAARQLERLFGLSGFAESVRAAPSSRAGTGATSSAEVTCPRHHPGLPALAALWSGAARVHGSDARLQVSVRKQAAQRGLGGLAALEVAAADIAPVQQVAAFYLYQLASSTAAAFLSRQSASVAADSSSQGAAAGPPGLKGRGVTGHWEAAAAVKGLADSFQLLERARRLQQQARGLFPRLRVTQAASYAAAAGGGSCESSSASSGGSRGSPLTLPAIERQLADALQRAAFPEGEAQHGYEVCWCVT